MEILMIKYIIPFTASIVLASGCTAASHAEQEVTEAVHAVYAAINSKDADALIDLILAEGYTEYSGSGGTAVLISPQYLRDVLTSDLAVNFVAQDIDVSVIGQSAVVTGYRAGSIKFPDGRKSAGTFRLSMFWIRDSGKWLLAHVHLSPSLREHAESEVREIHNQWFEGLLNEDAVLLDSILSSDVTLSFPGGDVMPRSQFLAYLGGGELLYDTADHHALSVRIYGDAAVVNGKSTLSLRWIGESSTESLTYTATYVVGESGWHMVAWQSTVPMP